MTSAADFGDGVVAVSNNETAETEIASPSRLAATQGTQDDLSKRTLRALGDAAGPNRHPRRHAPPRDVVLTEEPSGWVSADRRTNKARPAASKTAASKPETSETARTATARASVRWADARGDDGQAVRPAADWSGAATLMLRPTAGRFNPLRNEDRRDEDASFKTRGLNPLRAK